MELARLEGNVDAWRTRLADLDDELATTRTTVNERHDQVEATQLHAHDAERSPRPVPRREHEHDLGIGLA